MKDKFLQKKDKELKQAIMLTDDFIKNAKLLEHLKPCGDDLIQKRIHCGTIERMHFKAVWVSL